MSRTDPSLAALLPLLLAPGLAAAAPQAAAPPAPTAAPTAVAEEAPVLTLQAALARAWNEAPSVAASQAQLQAARARIDVAAAPQWPLITGNVSAQGTGKNSNFLTTPPASQGNFASLLGYKGVTGNGNANASVGLQWLVFDFGRTSEGVRSAQLSADAAGSDLDATRQGAALAAGSAFLSLAADLQLIDDRKKIVGEDERLLEVAHGRVTSGVAAPIEETRAKVTLETAKLDVLTAEAVARNDAASLAIALGIDPNKPIRIEQPAAINVEDDPVRAADLAEQTRPEIFALKRRVQAAEAALASVRAGHFPAIAVDANLGVGPAFTTVADTGGTFAETGTIGAQLSVPILDFGLSAQITSAEASLRIAQTALHEESLNIRGAAAQAAIAVRSAAAAAEAAEQLRLEADENYKQAAGRYELGAASLLELVDAEAQQASATLSLIQSRVLVEQARLRLLAAVGSIGRVAGASKP